MHRTPCVVARQLDEHEQECALVGIFPDEVRKLQNTTPNFDTAAGPDSPWIVTPSRASL